MHVKGQELDGLFAHLRKMNRNTSKHKEIKRYTAIKMY